MIVLGIFNSVAKYIRLFPKASHSLFGLLAVDEQLYSRFICNIAHNRGENFPRNYEPPIG